MPLSSLLPPTHENAPPRRTILPTIERQQHGKLSVSRVVRKCHQRWRPSWSRRRRRRSIARYGRYSQVPHALLTVTPTLPLLHACRAQNSAVLDPFDAVWVRGQDTEEDGHPCSPFTLLRIMIFRAVGGTLGEAKPMYIVFSMLSVHPPAAKDKKASRDLACVTAVCVLKTEKRSNRGQPAQLPSRYLAPCAMNHIQTFKVITPFYLSSSGAGKPETMRCTQRRVSGALDTSRCLFVPEGNPRLQKEVYLCPDYPPMESSTKPAA